MTKYKSSRQMVAPPETSTRGRSDDHHESNGHDDPTKEWSLTVGVRRGTAFAGRRERLRVAEARGAAERGDNSGSSGEKPKSTKRRSKSVSKSSKSDKADTKAYAKQRSLHQKKSSECKDDKARRPVSAKGSMAGRKRGNDASTGTMTTAVATSTSISSTTRNVKQKVSSSTSTSKYTVPPGKHKDLVAIVAGRQTKTTSTKSVLPSNRKHHKQSVATTSQRSDHIPEPQPPKSQRKQPSLRPQTQQHGRGSAEASSFRTSTACTTTDTASKPRQEDSSFRTTTTSRSRQVPGSHTTTTTEITSNVRKKRKADSITTGSILHLHECEPTARDDFEDEGDDSGDEALSLTSTHSFLERHRRPRKKQRKERTSGKVSSANNDNGSGAIEFRLTKETSVLALIEGISHLEPHLGSDDNINSSINPFKSPHEYGQNVAKHKRPEESPRTGSPQELPAICLRGTWKAEWKAETEVQPSEGGNNGDNKDALSEYRLCIRHTSWLGMGPLPPTTSTRDGKLKGGAVGDTNNGDITVSCMFPLKKRVLDPSRHNRDASKSGNGNMRHEAFIGSICLFGCKGFDSSSEMNTKPRAMVRGVQENVKHRSFEQEHAGEEDDDAVEKQAGSVPLMFPVAVEGGDNFLGISIPCALPLETNYHLRFAQDQSLKNNQIVAVDVIFNEDISGQSPHASPAALRSFKEKSAAKAQTPLTEESSKEHTRNVGYNSTLDTVRDGNLSHENDRSHGRLQGTMGQSLKGRRENVAKKRYAPPSSSSEDDDFNGMGSQYFSPISKDSSSTDDPKLRNRGALTLRDSDRMSAQRPKSLVHKFEEEASRSEEEAKKASLERAVAPAKGKKKSQGKPQKSEIFRKKETKGNGNEAGRGREAFSRPQGPKQSKKEKESRRVSLESPPLKNNGKRQAVYSKRVVPPTPPAKLKSAQPQSPDSFGSWSDDWGGSSVGGSDIGDGNCAFDPESPVIVLQGRAHGKKAKQKTSRADVGLLVSEDERNNRKQKGKQAKPTTKRVQKKDSRKSRSRQHVAEDDGESIRQGNITIRNPLDRKPRHAPQTGKRRWLPVIALLFVIGGSRKEMIPRHPLTMALTRQKKKSLPPPIRLTNKNPKSFSLESTIW